MNIKVNLVIESEEGTLQSEHEVAQLKRNQLSPATLGLTLSDAKQILQSIQQVMVEHQVETYIGQQIPSPVQLVVNLESKKANIPSFIELFSVSCTYRVHDYFIALAKHMQPRVTLL